MAGKNGSAVYGSIESANIVGYTQAELQEFGLTAGAAFIPVSGQNFDLTDLSVTGYDAEEGTDSEMYVQTLDEYGRTVASFFWVDVEDVKGWFNEDGEQVAAGDVTFQAGEGLWSFCDFEGFGLQSAGQVPQSDVAVILQEFGLSIANPTPVAVDLTKCVVTGYDTEEGSDSEMYIQTLDEYGRTVASYFWVDVDGVIGWYNEDGEEVAEGDVVVQPGAGLWSFCDYDGFNFVWPKVSL